MRIFRIAALLASAIFASSAQASAAIITFTHTGIGSGSIGGVSFGPSSFTITALGDTEDIAHVAAGVYVIPHDDASISIAGVGSYEFTTGTRTFFNDNNNDTVGFSRLSGADLFYSASDAALNGWQMQTSIGPVFDTGALLQWASSPVMTSGGQLLFNNGSGPSAFTARVSSVPEPASMLLLGMSLAAAGVRRWRQRNA